ncbi:MAG: cell division protein FtsH [Ktedonobacter sp. 13_1_20CM_4_53_11]|jgi:cell division protease FtsH|nr:MAG: cell division protein FtsH [Ktedonobacter sp. 13_2_20CM_53_11]OLB56539.1 MAG: cell division protein FtsH [Ktedonobacter sp. 13_2_20CM_2_56_8]OLE06988.1 MAG: cell division protein FtsH [Ktedonobacter sp. 13_1_20CM_4_53_11]TMC58146.1 MAG: ATP-dependent zinc metalloprotease FtsH [Chloroflexota bacterium]TMD89658.1 MAG: ATP-dependent zinc metalloprotease FtsH [Chloroflexota bacterium]
MSNNGKWIRTSLLLLLVTLAIVLVVVFFRSPSDTQSVNVSTILADIKTDMHKNQQDTLNVASNTLTLTRGNAPDAAKEAASINDTFDTTQVLKDNGINYSNSHLLVLQYEPPSALGAWVNILVSFIPFIAIGALLIFMMRQAQGSNNQALSFGKSRARMFMGNKPTVTFADVAGVEEAKQELQEIVEFLKYPEKFVALGARIPKGLLLVGPPGTGKTLISRAVAGEAGVPFFSISGSEFVEMFVGVGASRVRDLFDQAKRNSPCIVFVDEIDAVGRQRGAGLGGSHDEREQTLNQILVEMDGFDTNTNVIVIAATNRPDVLDPALLRPGRFDRQVVLDRPDIRGRVAILQVHAKGKPLDKNISLDTLAKQTPGFSGADLSNLLNEAAILGARRNKRTIGMSELEEAIDRVVAGPARKSRIISEREKAITAYHEVGHALVARLLPNTDPVHKVSIVARGQAGGFTMLLPTEDRYLWSKPQFEDMLAYVLGGHVAELIIFGEVTTGASNDIERVTKIARSMVTEYGMSSRIGPMALGHKEELVFLGRDFGEQRNYSEQTAREIDEEVRNIIQEAFDKAYNIVMQNKTRMIMISERLIKEETLEGPLFESLFNQPINNDQYESPSILAGIPGIKLSGNTEQGKLLPEPVNQQFKPPSNADLS